MMEKDSTARQHEELINLNEMIKAIHFEKKIVLGEGSFNPQIMLIGEAPGRNEVDRGRPFVGAAGKQLDELLKFAEIERSKIYISNIVKFRISRINPLTGREVNRPVKRSELISERVWLLKEIEIVSPKFICTLGNSSLQGLTGELKLMIGDIHGEVIERNLQGIARKIFPLYHPASIIYNRALFATYEEDMNKLKILIRGIQNV